RAAPPRRLLRERAGGRAALSGGSEDERVGLDAAPPGTALPDPGVTRAAAAVPLSADLLGLRDGRAGAARRPRRNLARALPSCPLPPLGRQRLRPGAAGAAERPQRLSLGAPASMPRRPSP